LWLIPSLVSNQSSSVDIITCEITICDYYAHATKYSIYNVRVIDTFASATIVDLVTLEIFSAKHVDGFKHTANEIH
jgi:hypothetical protein